MHNQYIENAWNEYQKEHQGELNASTGLPKTRGELAADYNASKPTPPSKNAGKTHANSLDYDGANYGYILFDKNTGEVCKFGESIRPKQRYTKEYLKDNGVNMKIVKKGSKKAIHDWQHEMIINYKKRHNDERPRLNLSDY